MDSVSTAAFRFKSWSMFPALNYRSTLVLCPHSRCCHQHWCKISCYWLKQSVQCGPILDCSNHCHIFTYYFVVHSLWIDSIYKEAAKPLDSASMHDHQIRLSFHSDFPEAWLYYYMTKISIRDQQNWHWRTAGHAFKVGLSVEPIVK